jgi:hypothetical protein
MQSLQERFEAFEQMPPADLFGDPIWRLPAYRIALFLSDIGQADWDFLRKTSCPAHIVDQLLRSVDSAERIFQKDTRGFLVENEPGISKWL